VEPKRFQLDGPTLPELKARILAEHGADARIISAERVTIGGIRGFFARRHYEVTVEVPERRRRAAHAQADRVVPPAGEAMPDRAARLGILALLEDADGADDAGTLTQPRQAAASPQLSTGSAGFAQLMDELTFSVSAPSAASAQPAPSGQRPVSEQNPLPARSRHGAAGSGTDAGAAPGPGADLRPIVLPAAPGRPLPGITRLAAVPRPLSRPGDLVVLVGPPVDALRVAGMMAAMNGAGEVLVAGSVVSEGARRVDDRRSALAARAGGVARGRTCFLAFGIGESATSREYLGGDLIVVGADQTWAVVDAGRKPADTAAWVSLVAAATTIDALAVVAAGSTASPETVDELGVPVGWVDGASAASTTLGRSDAVLPDALDARARLA
jgi:hypothetical protein